MGAIGKRFEDKTVMITGGAGAIGSAAARRFAAEGARLVILDRDRDRTAALAREFGKAGVEVLVLNADVGSKDEVDSAVSETVARLGRIDVLFNNAGVAGKVAPVHELAVEDWDEIIRI